MGPLLLVLGLLTSLAAPDGHWQAATAEERLTSLRCDPSGKGRFGSELLCSPLSASAEGRAITITEGCLSREQGGRTLRLTLPGQGPTVLAWPIDLGPDGYYDRLTGRSTGADRQDHPALHRFTALGSGHTLVIESFKRMARVPSLPSLRNDKGRSLLLQTADGAQVTLDGGPGSTATFAFELGRLVMRFHATGRVIRLGFAPSGPGVALEKGRLPSFAFAGDVPLANSTGGKTSLNRLLNDFYLQAGYWYPSGTGLTCWGEWGALGHSYVDGPYRQDVFNPLCGQVVGDDGYGRDGLAWSWGDRRGWPFPGGYDTRHLNVNAVQICAIRQYLLWTGERGRTRGRDFGLRVADGTKTLLAQEVADHPVRIAAGHLLSQPFTAAASFDRLALRLRAPAVDPVLGEGALTQRPALTRRVDRWNPLAVASAPGTSVAQVIRPDAAYNTVGISTPTWSTRESGGRLRLFRWTGDYAASSSAAPLAELRIAALPDNAVVWALAPEMLPAGTETLLVLDEPTTTSTMGPPRTGIWHTSAQDGDRLLGPAFRGGVPWPGQVVRLHFGTRWKPEVSLTLRDAGGKAVWSTTAPRDVPTGEAWWPVELGRWLPAGRYTLEATGSDAGVEWLSSLEPTALGGKAAQDGHTWDWLERARRMMAYQLDTLNGRSDGVLKFDRKCGDGDHLGLNGRSIGNNYYDILPFGYLDAYAGAWFYRSLVAMAELEQAYGDPRRAAECRILAGRAARRYNELYWTAKGQGDGAARYVGCIDADGAVHDLGFTFVNLLAVSSGLAPADRSEAVLRWLDTGSTRDAQGKLTPGDIYAWRFGPRCTTLDNPNWWAAQQNASAYPWGDQIQNGGADLYESHYDILARLRTRGGDDGYRRLLEMLRRYAEPDRLTGGGPLVDGRSVQGGGTAGGAGVMSGVFPETAMLAGVVLHGFLGAEANAAGLTLRPKLPRGQAWVEAIDILYRGARLTIRATHTNVTISARSGGAFRWGGRTVRAPFNATAPIGRDGTVTLQPL